MKCNNNIYLIEYNNVIIGAYDNELDANIFIESCQQNGFMTHPVKIITFIRNSCIKQSINNTEINDTKTKNKIDDTIIKQDILNINIYIGVPVKQRMVIAEQLYSQNII